MGVYPQVDYGQGSGAWIPASRAPVYQAMERARREAGFARLFAADILFGREESGGHYWEWQPDIWYRVAGYSDLHLGSGYTQEDYPLSDSESGTSTPGWRFYNPSWGGGENGPYYQWRPKGGAFSDVGTPARRSCKWLYNENTLNASKTWVAQLFGPPSTLSGGTWFKTGAYCTGSDWGFIAEDSPTGDTLRMLQEGHWAFEATGCNGVIVRVPYAADSKPLKEGRGRWECGNSKKIPQGRYYR